MRLVNEKIKKIQIMNHYADGASLELFFRILYL